MFKLINFMVVTFIICALPQDGVGQVKDPFKTEASKDPFSKKRTDDPFAPGDSNTANADDPFGSSKKKQQSNLPDHILHILRQNDLTDREKTMAAAIRVLQRQLLEFEIRNKQLVQKINTTEDDNKRQKEKQDKASQLHSKLLGEFLNSSDKTIQTLALVHIYSTIEEAAASGQPIPTYTPAVFSKLESLVDSEDQKIHAQAVKIMSIMNPTKLRSIGFQFGEAWEPVDLASNAAMKIRRGLSTTCSMNYDQTLLEEILDELSDNYQIDTQVEGVDLSTKIIFKVSSIRLGTALEMLLEEHGLTYCVTETSLLIIKKGNPKAFQPRTYQVRGLLTEELDVNGISKLINAQFAGDDRSVETIVVDAQRLMVTGTEGQHRNVALLLGQLIKRTSN